ncbi:MAG TPA: hypothetical protein DEB06_11080 [Phycisphaerales bacterium]|nr:hypothetical protein [Phycisphaerales bacterium]
MLFTGEHEHTIDAKNRLAIPAGFRAQWRESRDGAAWYAVPWVGGVIRLYTERAFEERAAAGRLTLTPEEDEAELQATLYGLTARTEMDSAGRVRLPDGMLALVGLGSEVVLIGAGDRLEIRDRSAWRSGRTGRLAQMPVLMSRVNAKRQGRGGE